MPEVSFSVLLAMLFGMGGSALESTGSYQKAVSVTAKQLEGTWRCEIRQATTLVYMVSMK